MNEPIASLKTILLEATAAAHKYVDVNYACPYPFTSESGRIFRNAFMAERNRLLMEGSAPQKPTLVESPT